MPKDYEIFRNDYTFKEKLRLFKAHIFGASQRYEMTAPMEVPSGEALNKISGQKIKIAFLGDVMPLGKYSLEISEEIKKIIVESDIIVLNLEGIINPSPRILALRHTEQTLKELEKIAPRKKFLINVANNHAGDFGKEAFVKSCELLKQKGFNIIGTETKPTKEIGNINFCAFSEWSNQINPGINYIKPDKKKLSKFLKKGECNILIPHWGYEMEKHPSPEQISLSKSLLEEWDAIVGAHSHIPQEVTSYEKNGRKKFVSYSLGNFCFLSYFYLYQKGMVVQASFGKNKKREWCAERVIYKKIFFKPKKGKVIISPYVKKYNLPYKIGYYFFKELKYVLVLFWIIGYAIRHLTPIRVFSKINSDIPHGGKCTLPKSWVYEYFTKNNNYAKNKFVPIVKIPAGIQWNGVKKELEKIRDETIVLKPDKGIRSIGVRILKDEKDKKKLLEERGNFDYIAQEFVNYPHELGVFYIKYPEWKKGKILGIAYLGFRKVIGDGKTNLELLLKDADASPAMKAYVEKEFNDLKYVPKIGEEISLVNISGHGAEERYYNREDLITDKITDEFNKVVGEKEFKFGRFDVRAKSIDDFKKGNFLILEANSGPDAVALHALDPNFSNSKKLKIFIEQYRHAFAISKKIKGEPKVNGWNYFWFFVDDQLALSELKKKLKRKEI